MKHYIIVKYKDTVIERQPLYHEIAKLFSQATQMRGVFEVSLHTAVILSEKRYDLMICIDMERDALDAFDQSSLHCLWKKNFSQFIAHKVIFDCE